MTALVSSLHFLRMCSMDLSTFSWEWGIAINDQGSTSHSCEENKKMSPIIDIVSIGSMDRPSYLQAQANTWGRHSSIRFFVNATEEDDLDPDCSHNKTLEQVISHVQQCRRQHSSTKFLLQYKYFPPRFVLRKTNPQGWLCAQVRPGSGLGKIGRMYLHSKIPLPDYLFLIDDDTMINVAKFIETIDEGQPPSDDAAIYAGCLTIQKKSPFYRFSPYGGAGTFWNKRSIERIMQPLYCNATPMNENKEPLGELKQFIKKVCDRIQENLILEKTLFREGMRMFEFIEQVFQRAPNCFHSDWLVGHFVQYYYLSETIWEDGSFNSSYMLPLRHHESIQYYYNITSPIGRYCALGKNTCDENYTVCHYVTPQTMQDVTRRQRSHPV